MKSHLIFTIFIAFGGCKGKESDQAKNLSDKATHQNKSSSDSDADVKEAPQESPTLYLTIPADGAEGNGESLADFGAFLYYLGTHPTDEEKEDDKANLALTNPFAARVAGIATKSMPGARTVFAAALEEGVGAGTTFVKNLAEHTALKGNAIEVQQSLQKVAKESKIGLISNGLQQFTGANAAIFKQMAKPPQETLFKSAFEKVTNNLKDGMPLKKAFQDAYSNPQLKALMKENLTNEQQLEFFEGVAANYLKSKATGGLLTAAMTSQKSIERLAKGETTLAKEIDDGITDILNRLNISADSIDFKAIEKNYTDADGNPIMHLEIKGDNVTFHAPKETLDKLGTPSTMPMDLSDGALLKMAIFGVE